MAVRGRAGKAETRSRCGNSAHARSIFAREQLWPRCRGTGAQQHEGPFAETASSRRSSWRRSFAVVRSCEDHCQLDATCSWISRSPLFDVAIALKMVAQYLSHFSPANGAIAMARYGIGAAVLRKEDERFLHGRGQYVADFRLAGTRDVAFVRSPVAHARLRAIECSSRSPSCRFHREGSRRREADHLVAAAQGVQALGATDTGDRQGSLCR